MGLVSQIWTKQCTGNTEVCHPWDLGRASGIFREDANILRRKDLPQRHFLACCGDPGPVKDLGWVNGVLVWVFSPGVRTQVPMFQTCLLHDPSLYPPYSHPDSDGFLLFELLHWSGLQMLWHFLFLSFFNNRGEREHCPHYHKWCSRVSHIWRNRRGQHTRSAMGKPRPGKTTFMIMVSPLPVKYKMIFLH